jgi:cellulose synthase/poly-beta-1,6-N-acetylglucosamine synthase-like glycosyltransferase
MEVVIARGKQPSVQRNEAIRSAQGDWIYFLDDDACPLPQNLQKAAPHLSDPTVKMLGGPNLCPPEAPLLEQVFAVVLASWLAFGPSRARYMRVGTIRPSGEKELILCNLVARRADLLELGGFDESLYPNEENALMDDLQKRGGKLLYDPEFVVYRRPRPTLRAFIRMLLTYGRGRAEQFRLHPTPGSALNFVPPLFCVYLMVGPWFGWIGLLPLGAYFCAVLGQSIISTKDFGVKRSFLAIPLVVCTHIFYGLGFWRGLFTRLRPKGATERVEVALEKFTL